jgi:hypothetical protein
VGEFWASDTPVSLPEPPKRERPAVLDFGGFGFSAGGLTHNITETDLEEMATPTFAPPVTRGNDG